MTRRVLNKSGITVCGIGFNDGKYPTYAYGKKLKEYKAWEDMLYRCTEKEWVKHPNYIGTTCSENFKLYSFFYEWCQTQIGFGVVDEKGRKWQLDKDLLSGDGKVYSEDVCVFVPQRVNKLLTKRDNDRGELPIGVHLDRQAKNKKYRSMCNDLDVRKSLGRFPTKEEAFQAYKIFKEALIKRVAHEYKLVLDYRVYLALISYEVNIND